MRDKPGTPSGSEDDRQGEYMKAGKGRKDEVGRSGIYPASAADVPPDAIIRSEGELTGQTRLRRSAADRQDDQAAINRESGSD